MRYSRNGEPQVALLRPPQQIELNRKGVAGHRRRPHRRWRSTASADPPDRERPRDGLRSSSRTPRGTRSASAARPPAPRRRVRRRSAAAAETCAAAWSWCSCAPLRRPAVPRAARCTEASDPGSPRYSSPGTATAATRCRGLARLRDGATARPAGAIASPLPRNRAPARRRAAIASRRRSWQAPRRRVAVEVEDAQAHRAQGRCVVHGVAVRAQRLQRGQAAERREVHDAVGADVEYA